MRSTKKVNALCFWTVKMRRGDEYPFCFTNPRAVERQIALWRKEGLKPTKPKLHKAGTEVQSDWYFSPKSFLIKWVRPSQ